MILDLGPSEFWGSWCAVGRPISTDILTFNGERRTKNRSVQSLSPGAGVWTGWRLSDSVLYLFSSPYLDILGVSTIYQPLLSPNPSTSKPQERFVEDLKMLSMFGDLNRNGSFLESRALDGRNNSLSFFFEKDWIYQTGLIIPHHLINANQPDHTRPYQTIPDPCLVDAVLFICLSQVQSQPVYPWINIQSIFIWQILPHFFIRYITIFPCETRWMGPMTIALVF